MLRSVLVVLGLLVGLSYTALFLMWNANTKADIVTWGLGETFWVGGIPVGFLVLVGALLGAVCMVLGVWGPWAAASASAKASEGKFQKAVTRLNEMKRQLAAKDEQIAKLTPAKAPTLEAAAAVTAESAVGSEPVEAPATDTPEATPGSEQETV